MTRVSTKSRSRDSFTLIEMLVSMAILAVFAATLVAMLSTVMSNWQQNQARGERRSTARRALTLMTRDLSLTAQPLNLADTNSLQFLIDPSTTGLASYLLPHAIFWQAAVATDTGSTPHQGNLAVVGYFIRLVGTEYCLCRLLVNPSSTTVSSTTPNYAIYTNPTGWLTNALPSSYQWAASPSYQGLVGENVLGLWAQALDINGNPITKTAAGTSYSGVAYDSRQGYSYLSANGNTYAYGPTALPAAVRLGLVVIDSRTAKRTIPSITQTATTNLLADIQTFVAALPKTVQQGAEIYTQVVPLPHVPQ